MLVAGDYYFVMPLRTMEWEVAQYRGKDRWFRIGLERPMQGSEIGSVGPKIEHGKETKKAVKGKKMRERFIQDAVDAGFTQEQAEFMWDALAQKPHTHSVDEITGLEEAIAEEVAEIADGEDDEDDDDDED